MSCACTVALAATTFAIFVHAVAGTPPGAFKLRLRPLWSMSPADDKQPYPRMALPPAEDKQQQPWSSPSGADEQQPPEGVRPANDKQSLAPAPSPANDKQSLAPAPTHDQLTIPRGLRVADGGQPNAEAVRAADDLLPYPRYEVLDEECSALQRRMVRDLQNLQDVSCQRLKTDGVEKVTQGCECRVLRTEATGGTCPYDCSRSGVPSCVENTAKELGLMTVTSSAPLSVPKDSGSAYLEAVLCTYWDQSSQFEEDQHEELSAQSAGRLQALDIMKKVAADADSEADETVRKLYKAV